jgi:hypothetical protein
MISAIVSSSSRTLDWNSITDSVKYQAVYRLNEFTYLPTFSPTFTTTNSTATDDSTSNGLSGIVIISCSIGVGGALVLGIILKYLILPYARNAIKNFKAPMSSQERKEIDLV